LCQPLVYNITMRHSTVGANDSEVVDLSAQKDDLPVESTLEEESQRSQSVSYLSLRRVMATDVIESSIRASTIQIVFTNLTNRFEEIGGSAATVVDTDAAYPSPETVLRV
jgi:hypothetical protein